MNDPSLEEWLSRNDDELVETLADELRQHISHLRSEGGFYAYSVLSLAGDMYKLQYVAAAFNRESDLRPDHADEVYYRLSPNEWANYGLEAFPKTSEIVNARNATFSSLHTKKSPDDYMLDDFEIGHITNLHRSILRAMKRLRDEQGLGGNKSFAVLWAPDSPDDILFCSAKALNTPATFDDFWNEFGEDFLELDCDCFD